MSRTVYWKQEFKLDEDADGFETWGEAEVTVYLEGTRDAYSIDRIWVTLDDPELAKRIVNQLWESEQETLSRAIDETWS